MSFEFRAALKTLAASIALVSTAATPWAPSRWAPSLRAHDPGLSALEIRLEAKSIDVSFTFARQDMERLVTTDSPIEVRFDGQVATLGGVSREEGDGTDVRLVTRIPRPEGARTLEVASLLLGRLPRGHRQVLTAWSPSGRKLAERLLDARSFSFSLPLDEGAHEAPPSAFQGFLLLGVEHILTGYDHLAFLLALLLAGGTLLQAVKIITSFTVAHSITLGLSALDLLSVPSSIVEPLIALSILYVGVENLFRPRLERRWLLTFAFGLIHGFGFATVLRGMGLGTDGTGVALPLLSFNLGVEAGQLTIAGILFPLLRKLGTYPSFALRFAPAASIAVALLGGWWLLERTLLS